MFPQILHYLTKYLRVVFESTLFILTVYLAVCRFTSYQSFGALYRSLLRDGTTKFLFCHQFLGSLLGVKASSIFWLLHVSMIIIKASC